MEKVVIIGAGFISHSHAQALKNCGVEIYGIIDKVEAAAKNFADKWNITRYSTSEELAFEQEVTTVHVCTPPNTHYSLVKKLLEHGKNVICEKPLCFSSEEAKELANLAREKNRKCAVNFNVRYHNMSSKMKEMVQDKNFGTPYLIHGTYLQQFHLLPTMYNWRYEEELSGKMRAVTEIGTHWFDIVQYVTGLKIKKVSACFGNFNPNRRLQDGMMYPMTQEERKEEKIVEVKSEDVALLHLQFENGAIGSVVLSEVSQGYSNYLSYEISSGTKTIGWNSQNNNEIYFNESFSQMNVIRDGFGNGFDDSFIQLVSNFYQSSSENSTYPNFEEGANIVCICNAIYESAIHDSKWIEIE